MSGLGNANVFQPIRELYRLFRGRNGRRDYEKRIASLEGPWNVLGLTGNGIGGAPMSIRAIPVLDEARFDELYLDELLNIFWHQYTIYIATPFAVQEVLEVLASAPRSFQERLLHFVLLALHAERSGAALTGCNAGVWLPAEETEKLRAAGITRPSVEAVLRSRREVLGALADDSLAEAVTRELATKLLEMLR